MIPIYRGRKIGSNEWVEGYHRELNFFKKTHNIFPETNSDGHFQVDPNTLAIHFTNMIDKNGKKIFASLSEDGVGGDEFVYPLWRGWDEPHNKMVAVFENGYKAKFIFDGKYTVMNYKNTEVIGIHKGES